MDGVHILKHQAVHRLVGQGVHQMAVHQVQVVGDVFRLGVEARRDGDPVPAAVFQGRLAQEKRGHDVDDVHAVQGAAQHCVVGYGDGNAVPAHVIVQRPHVELGHHKKAFLSPPVFIRTDHAHLVAPAAQETDQVHGGDGGAVVFFSQHVADHGDFHGHFPPRRSIRVLAYISKIL